MSVTVVYVCVGLLRTFCITLRNVASGLPPAVVLRNMINNDGKYSEPHEISAAGVTSFGDRETGSGLSAGSTASVQPPLSQAAAAETTAAAATMSSWSCRTGSLAFEATGSSPCTSDVGHDHGQRDTMRTVMRDCQRQPAAAASIISPSPAANADATALLGKPSPNRLYIRQSSSDGGRFTTRSKRRPSPTLAMPREAMAPYSKLLQTSPCTRP